MPLPPALESEFELVEELPTGKIFQCYQVKDMRKGGSDAVVRLLPEKFAADQSIVNRFHDFFARFNDIPNRRYIPSVYSVVGVPGKDVYVVEEYCPGVSLPQFVNSYRKSETFITDVTEILARVCEGLHHAHQKTISHLCVLPSDILIDEHDHSKVKLVGFGAQIFAEKGKIDYLSGESRKYVAPEVFKRGVFGPKADVYSLAVTIKELLPEFSERSDLLAKALSITLKDRFSSARQFAASLKGVAVAGPGAEPAPKVTKPSRPARPKGGLNLVLKITTEPDGAEVFSNRTLFGTTSVSGLMVPWKPGNVIEIKKPGYSTETLNFQAPPDNTEINVKLNSAVRLFTNPWGATVKVNGELLGTTAYTGLIIPWDKGEIVVEKQGFKPETFTFETPPFEEQYFVELEPDLAPVTERLKWPSPESMSVPHKFWVSLISGIRTIPTASDIKVLGYGLAGLLALTLVVVLLVNGLIGRPGIEKQQTEMSSQLQQKDAEIWRLTQTDLEKSRSQSELQKQVFDLRAQSNNRDAEITKLTQEKLEEQRLRKTLESQLSAANSELMKKSDEINRLKSAQTKSSPVITGSHPLNTELGWAAESGDGSRVSGVLAQGADPNAINNYGYTPLMRASMRGHLQVVETLLKYGADKNLKSLFGDTAYDLAIKFNHTSLLPLFK